MTLSSAPVTGHIPSAYTDIRGVQNMATDTPEALERVAAQFESLFMNIWLKSMREAGSVFSEGNPFSSPAVETHQQMLDSQYAVHLSEAGGIGIGSALVAQLSAKAAPDAPQALNESPAPERVYFPRHADGENLTVTRFGNRSSLYENAREFIDDLLPVVEKTLKDSVLNPAAVLAQAALETGWGQNVIHDGAGTPSFNLFGVKAHEWNGPSTSIMSMEHGLGGMQPEQSDFRMYGDWQESISDYLAFLNANPRYRDVVEQGGEPERFARALQQSGYATDPDYASKVLSVLDTIYELSGD